MSLLASVTQPSGNPTVTGSPQYYFALDSTPDTPTVTAPAFVAIGAAPSNNGSMTVFAEDQTGGGTEAFVMSTASGVGADRWAIGMNGIETGANSGDNFAIYSYSDTGAFLAAPLQIVRATGGVIMPVGLNTAQALVSGLTTTESLIVGDGTEVAGGVAQINGTLGVGQVYDTIYNPALAAQSDFLFNFTGAPITSPVDNYGTFGTFTVPETGLYIVTSALTVNVDAVNSATFGASDFVAVRTNVASPIVGPVFKPFSMPNTAGGGVDYQLSGSIVVKMLAATPYQAQIFISNISGTASYLGGVIPILTIARLC